MPLITGIAKSHSRVSPAIGRNTVVVGDQAAGTVYALSKVSGQPVWHTTLATDRGAIITSSPVVVGDRVYVGVSSGQEGIAVSTRDYVPTFRGSVAALDANDGHILWQTFTVPPGFTGGAVWSSTVAVDPARHAVYLTSGNNYSVPGAVAACQIAATNPVELDACLPADDHIDSIVSLNSDSGAVTWGQRFEGADTWTVSCLKLGFVPATPCPSPAGPDFDFGAGANLFSFHRDGVRHDAVGAGQKSGMYWALDRDTGRTLWATQVGPSGPLGGILWGTPPTAGASTCRAPTPLRRHHADAVRCPHRRRLLVGARRGDRADPVADADLRHPAAERRQPDAAGGAITRGRLGQRRRRRSVRRGHGRLLRRPRRPDGAHHKVVPERRRGDRGTGGRQRNSLLGLGLCGRRHGEQQALCVLAGLRLAPASPRRSRHCSRHCSRHWPAHRRGRRRSTRPGRRSTCPTADAQGSGRRRGAAVQAVQTQRRPAGVGDAPDRGAGSRATRDGVAELHRGPEAVHQREAVAAWRGRPLGRRRDPLGDALLPDQRPSRGVDPRGHRGGRVGAPVLPAAGRGGQGHRARGRGGAAGPRPLGAGDRPPTAGSGAAGRRGRARGAAHQPADAADAERVRRHGFFRSNSTP